MVSDVADTESGTLLDGVTYRWRDQVTDDEMVELVKSHGGRSEAGWWDRIRPHSLGWVTARLPDGTLVGFVNVASDGGITPSCSTPRRMESISTRASGRASCSWPPRGLARPDASGFTWTGTRTLRDGRNQSRSIHLRSLEEQGTPSKALCAFCCGHRALSASRPDRNAGFVARKSRNPGREAGRSWWQAWNRDIVRRRRSRVRGRPTGVSRGRVRRS